MIYLKVFFDKNIFPIPNKTAKIRRKIYFGAKKKIHDRRKFVRECFALQQNRLIVTRSEWVLKPHHETLQINMLVRINAIKRV